MPASGVPFTTLYIRALSKTTSRTPAFFKYSRHCLQWVGPFFHCFPPAQRLWDHCPQPQQRLTNPDLYLHLWHSCYPVYIPVYTLIRGAWVSIFVDSCKFVSYLICWCGTSVTCLSADVSTPLKNCTPHSTILEHFVAALVVTVGISLVVFTLSSTDGMSMLGADWWASYSPLYNLDPNSNIPDMLYHVSHSGMPKALASHGRPCN